MGNCFAKVILQSESASSYKKGIIPKYNSLMTILLQLLIDIESNVENNSTAWCTVHPSKSALGLACNVTIAFC